MKDPVTRVVRHDSPLMEKIVLVVDDEPDVLETVAEELDMCLVHKAGDYGTAVQYLANYTYDIVILDIMGVSGFDLLKQSVYRGFPTVMLTAHALSPESLKKSMKLGAVFFLPKERMTELPHFLEEVVLGGNRPIWDKLFDWLSDYFSKRFGNDWKERDMFFKEYEEELKEDAES
ncbi:MAG: response regulator [Thermodesulfobacteriota bacterium]|nr:response regulator [Thermodesulfobacteriota bacterium]